MRSGHGTGKSTSASWAMLWFLFLRFPNKVVVTAPTSGQLFDALFAEMKRWINELPPNLKDMVTVKSDRVELTAAASPKRLSRPARLAPKRRRRWPECIASMFCWSSTRRQVCRRRCSRLLLGQHVWPQRHHGAAEQPHAILWHVLREPDASSPAAGGRAAGHALTARLSATSSLTRCAMRYGEESNAFRIRVLGEFSAGR